MDRVVRYATTEDGVRIAYSVEGEGPPLLVCPNFIESFSLDHMVPIHEAFFARLREGRQLIRFDGRGTGLSQRDFDGELSLEAHCRDLDAVVDATGLRQVACLAPMLWGPIAARYAATHPDKVTALILWGTFATPLEFLSTDAVETLAGLCRTSWTTAAQLLGDRSTREAHAEFGLQFGALNAASTSGEVAARFILEWSRSMDVRGILADITAPTLVLHRLHSTLIPVAAGQALAAGIRGAAFIPLSGRTGHWAPEEPNETLDAINAFLRPARPVSPAPPVTRGVDLHLTMAAGSAQARTFASGRYTVRSVLGEGGQKVVYLVHDEALDRDCALSMVRSEMLEPEDLERLRREAQAMARLGAHSNIVTVHDMGDDDGKPYLVCEYVPAGELGRHLRDASAPLALDRALAIAADIARALAVAHGRGVIHRDVKPANVWLCEDGSAKLGDFGLAFSIGRTRMTMAGAVMGTATYMAPEQARGETADARTDLYALGVVLYEMVCGRPPFSGDDPLSVISQHTMVDPDAPVLHVAGLPPELNDLILRLLAKAPAMRPESAAAVGEELRAIRERLAARDQPVEREPEQT